MTQKLSTADFEAWLESPLTKALKQSHAEAIQAIKRDASFDRAELWLKRIDEAVNAEREACAQAAGPEDSYQDEWFKAKADAVNRIRARGNE